jgi:hypothetical protein
MTTDLNTEIKTMLTLNLMPLILNYPFTLKATSRQHFGLMNQSERAMAISVGSGVRFISPESSLWSLQHLRVMISKTNIFVETFPPRKLYYNKISISNIHPM